jgi:hypothetical protein
MMELVGQMIQEVCKTARRELTGCGTQTAALAFGGYDYSNTAATEEWTGAGAPTTKTITVS